MIGIRPAVESCGPKQSNILTVGQLDAGGHGFTTDSIIKALSDELNRGKITHTIRRGQLRFGLHAHNNIQDIDHVIDCLRERTSTSRQSP